MPSNSEDSSRFVDSDILVNCKTYGRLSVPALVEGLAHTYIDKVVLSKTFSAALTGQCGADNFADGNCFPLEDNSETLGLPRLGFKVSHTPRHQPFHLPFPYAYTTAQVRANTQRAIHVQVGDTTSTGIEKMLGEAGVGRCVCGQVYMWGANDFGQLGQGNTVGSFKPLLVTELSTLGIHIIQVALGAHHVLALSSKGNVYAWGYNSNGQLGTSDTDNRALPVRVRKKEPGQSPFQMMLVSHPAVLNQCVEPHLSFRVLVCFLRSCWLVQFHHGERPRGRLHIWKQSRWPTRRWPICKSLVLLKWG